MSLKSALPFVAFCLVCLLAGSCGVRKNWRKEVLKRGYSVDDSRFTDGTDGSTDFFSRSVNGEDCVTLVGIDKSFPDKKNRSCYVITESKSLTVEQLKETQTFNDSLDLVESLVPGAREIVLSSAIWPIELNEENNMEMTKAECGDFEMNVIKRALREDGTDVVTYSVEVVFFTKDANH